MDSKQLDHLRRVYPALSDMEILGNNAEGRERLAQFRASRVVTACDDGHELRVLGKDYRCPACGKRPFEKSGE